MDDLKLFVQSAVRVVHGVAKQGGNGEKVSAGSIERKQDRPLSGVAYTHRSCAVCVCVCVCIY